MADLCNDYSTTLMVGTWVMIAVLVVYWWLTKDNNE